jgi:hypothetical protein
LTHPNSTLCFANRSATEGAFYFAQDMEDAFGGAPVHLFLVDFTSTQMRVGPNTPET